MTDRIVIRAAGYIGSQAQPIDWGQTAAVDAPPSSLRAAASRIRPAMPRLSSRFAQLAVIGAQQCLTTLSHPLPADTPLILCTGLGDVAATDALYYEVMPPSGEMASPARFATSGNNMAGFFVARAAGISGRNFAVSQDALSFEQGLSLAVMWLHCHRATTVLIGSVDETTQPRDFYTRRFAPAMTQIIGEGSAWFVLAQQDAGDIRANRAAPQRRPVADLLLTKTLAFKPATADAWATDVIANLKASGFVVDSGSSMGLLPGCRLNAEEIDALTHQLPGAVCHDSVAASGCFPTAVGPALAALANGEFGDGLGQASLLVATRDSTLSHAWLHINRDAFGRTGMIVLRVLRADS